MTKVTTKDSRKLLGALPKFYKCSGRSKIQKRASLDGAIAIEELLRSTEWCLVQLLYTVDQPKPRSELVVEGIRVIANNIEAAAFCRALGSERAHDDVAAQRDGTRDLANRRGTLLGSGEEMKY